jgi:tetratricopeptide (TPR) repeat protein
LALLAGAAVVIGIAVAGVVWLTAGSTSKPVPKATPLSGLPPAVVKLPATVTPDPQDPAAVARAARKVLPAGDVRVRVAELMAADTMAHRQQTIAALRKLPQDSLPVGLALGIAQFWAGDVKPAVATLERVKHANMYGFYGTEADNLLNYREAPGYPSYTLAGASPKGSLATLRAVVKRHPTDSNAWLNLAWKLQTVNRAAAIAAAQRAESLAPGAVSPIVATNVLGFDKEDTATSLGNLMTLVRSHPTNDEIRFHVGLLFFWLRDRQDTIAQMRQVIANHPHGPYSAVAKVFITCLDDPNGTACSKLKANG